MAPNRSFTKFQKERKRQEKAAAKRQDRQDRRKNADSRNGSGPPIAPMDEQAESDAVETAR